MSKTAEVKNDHHYGAKPEPIKVEGGVVKGEKVPIPVHAIRFQAGLHVDLPGKTGATSCTTEKIGGRSWTIHKLPWQREFRVTYVEAGQSPAVRFVPESWCTWDPAPE